MDGEPRERSTSLVIPNVSGLEDEDNGSVFGSTSGLARTPPLRSQVITRSKAKKTKDVEVVEKDPKEREQMAMRKEQGDPESADMLWSAVTDIAKGHAEFKTQVEQNMHLIQVNLGKMMEMITLGNQAGGKSVEKRNEAVESASGRTATEAVTGQQNGNERGKRQENDLKRSESGKPVVEPRGTNSHESSGGDRRLEGRRKPAVAEGSGREKPTSQT